MIDETTIFIAFDTETTGLSAADGRIVEIAAVKFDLNGNELGRFAELVNPGQAIPEAALRVHKITDEMVAGSPPIDQVFPRFIDFFTGNGNILIAQNALFDIGFVNHEAHRNNIKLPRNMILDQIDLTRRAFPNLPTYSLEKTCRRFHIVETQAHRALSDSILVMKLFRHCLKRYETLEAKMAVLNSLYHYTFGGPMIVRIDEAMMKTIRSALDTGDTLTIIYSGGAYKGKPRQIIPLVMYNRDGVGYITARCLITNTNKQFRLDRIEECRLEKQA